MLENKIIEAILIVFVFWLASYVVTFIMTLLEKLTGRTKSSLDDKLIEAAKLPVRYLAVLLGFYFGARIYGFSWSWKGVNVETIFWALIILLLGFAASRMLKTFFDWYAAKEHRARKINKTMFRPPPVLTSARNKNCT